MALSQVPVLYGGIVLIGVLQGARMDTTGDQPVPLFYPGVTFRYNSTIVTNPIGNVGAAVGGIYTDPNKQNPVVLASTAYSLLTTNAINTSGNLVLPSSPSSILTTLYNVKQLYLSLTTAAVGPCTADFYLYGVLVPQISGPGPTFVV